MGPSSTYRPLRRRPSIIDEVGFDFRWDVRKVWALHLPVTTMPVTELDWHFDIPFWGPANAPYTLRPRNVLERPDRYPDEARRIRTADLRNPLDVMWWRTRWLYLDGLHRFARAVTERHSDIAVRQVPHEAIPAIAPGRP